VKKSIFAVFCAALLFGSTVFAQTKEEVLFDFESGLQGWEIPDWAFEKPDHLQKEVKVSDKIAKSGKQSLELDVDFPGNRWTGGIVEVMQYFDWSAYTGFAFDVYVPADAPKGLKIQVVLTVGDSWKWIESSKSFDLIPGQWITVIGDLAPGTLDWRRVQVDDSFRKDIRKVSVRPYTSGKPAYTGPVYIDDFRLLSK
jgi:hypothetical protein